MISLFLLCFVQVESAAYFDSGGVAKGTEPNVRRIAKSLERAELNSRFDEPYDHRLHPESILNRLVRSAEPNRVEYETKSIYLSPLRRYAQELLDEWVYPPISEYLMTVVIPGLVINHGKVADMGRLSLTAVAHQFVNDGKWETNMTIFHGNLRTMYKYNLDGPKGRLEVRAPSRIYSISLSSKQKGTQCVTKLSYLALEKEDELEFYAHGESSEDVDHHVKFVEHVLIMESRRTAFFNIQAAMERTLQTVNPPFCQYIQ